MEQVGWHETTCSQGTCHTKLTSCLKVNLMEQCCMEVRSLLIALMTNKSNKANQTKNIETEYSK